MKKISLLLLFSITFFSCKKNTDNASTAAFTITGVHDADLTVNSTVTAAFPISVVPNSGGASETVTLHADNLPDGVSATFAPASGATPFNSRVTFKYNFSGSGGIYPVKITGTGPSGSRSYDLNLTLDFYRGWRLGDSTYYKTDLEKDPGNATHYPNIKVFSITQGRLMIGFGIGKGLPVANKTYKITATSGATDDIQISMYDDPIIYSATGAGSPTGTFTFDSLGKFTFKCHGVEMTNGLQKKLLDCSFSE